MTTPPELAVRQPGCHLHKGLSWAGEVFSEEATSVQQWDPDSDWFQRSTPPDVTPRAHRKAGETKDFTIQASRDLATLEALAASLSRLGSGADTTRPTAACDAEQRDSSPAEDSAIPFLSRGSDLA